MWKLFAVFLYFSLVTTEASFEALRKFRRSIGSQNSTLFDVQKNFTDVSNAQACGSLCAQTWPPILNKNNCVAFQYDSISKLCHIGVIGTFGGDFDDWEVAAKPGIHVLAGCLPKSSVLNPNMFFYLSYNNDNPNFVAYLRQTPTSDVQMLPYSTYTGSQYRYYITSPIPSFGGIFVAGDTSTTYGYPQYDVPSFTPTSISVFAWFYQTSVVYGNNFIFLSNGGSPTNSFTYSQGGISNSGQSSYYPTVRLNTVSYTGYTYPTSLKWVFMGVVYDQPSGVLNFYENGTLKSTVAASRVTWTPMNLITVKHMRHPSTTSYDDYSAMYTANVELFLKSMTAAQVMDEFNTNAKNLYHLDNC